VPGVVPLLRARCRAAAGCYAGVLPLLVAMRACCHGCLFRGRVAVMVLQLPYALCEFLPLLPPYRCGYILAAVTTVAAAAAAAATAAASAAAANSLNAESSAAGAATAASCCCC